MEETLFYVFGIALVLSALVLSALGLRIQRFPSRAVLAGTVAYFVVLVGATSTFAVLNAREEQRVRDAEHAEEAAEAEPAAEEVEGSPGRGQAPPPGGGEPPPPPGNPSIASVSSPADGSLVFEPSELTAAGAPDGGAARVTIEYDNPSPVDHSVAIEEGSKTLAESEIVTEATTRATAELKPGEFVFYCTVPGHREAGMEGTLTVE
jgi:plastocyanin